jgi:ferritin-like protein
MASETYHEPLELLSEETKDLHRAITSLREELEAVDWYQQRAEACRDQELRAILVHNRDEEVEHAAMVLEWIRRRSPAFAENLATYLGTVGPITEIEEQRPASGGPSTACAHGSLGVGSLRARG